MDVNLFSPSYHLVKLLTHTEKLCADMLSGCYYSFWYKSVSMRITGIILRFVEERNHDTNSVLFILYNFSYMGQNNTAWYKIRVLE